MKKRIFILFVIITLLLSTSAQAFYVSAMGACSMDFESGEFLYEKNTDLPMTPASLAKIMTLYIVFEKMADGSLKADTPIVISENAAMLSELPGITNIPLNAGETVSLGVLIDAIVIVSACAACSAIAEHISGSEENFTVLMNETAQRIGLNAYFTDASGLSDENSITVKSVALLVREFIKKYPDILNYTKKTKMWADGKEYKTTNRFLHINDENYLKSVDGFKTGTTTLAGKCIVATASMNDTRVISVLMKAETNDLRYSESKMLIDSAFERVRYLNTNMFSTDIKTYIDGVLIPCSYSLGRKKALCITAENLNFYGFDTYYDASSSTLYISENDNKDISPVKAKQIPPSVPLYKIYDQPSLKVVLVQNGVQIPLDTVFSLNGQCCISFDELGAYFSYSWDDNARCAYILTD